LQQLKEEEEEEEEEEGPHLMAELNIPPHSLTANLRLRSSHTASRNSNPTASRNSNPMANLHLKVAMPV